MKVDQGMYIMGEKPGLSEANAAHYVKRCKSWNYGGTGHLHDDRAYADVDAAACPA